MKKEGKSSNIISVKLPISQKSPISPSALSPGTSPISPTSQASPISPNSSQPSPNQILYSPVVPTSLVSPTLMTSLSPSVTIQSSPNSSLITEGLDAIQKDLLNQPSYLSDSAYQALKDEETSINGAVGVCDRHLYDVESRLKSQIHPTMRERYEKRKIELEGQKNQKLQRLAEIQEAIRQRENA